MTSPQIHKFFKQLKILREIWETAVGVYNYNVFKGKGGELVAPPMLRANGSDLCLRKPRPAL